MWCFVLPIFNRVIMNGHPIFQSWWIPAHSKYCMPIHYDTIEDGQNKSSLVYSLNQYQRVRTHFAWSHHVWKGTNRGVCVRCASTGTSMLPMSCTLTLRPTQKETWYILCTRPLVLFRVMQNIAELPKIFPYGDKTKGLVTTISFQYQCGLPTAEISCNSSSIMIFVFLLEWWRSWK